VESGSQKIQDIAVIGLCGKYPGANSVEDFWENLKSGKDCIVEIPKERWDYNIYQDEYDSIPGAVSCKWGGFIEGAEYFDPLFFNISPREAEIMDPQTFILDVPGTFLKGELYPYFKYKYESRKVYL
jgi:acyl transferase domain-containing protein